MVRGVCFSRSYRKASFDTFENDSINACDSLISTVPGHLAAPSALPVPSKLHVALELFQVPSWSVAKIPG